MKKMGESTEITGCLYLTVKNPGRYSNSHGTIAAPDKFKFLDETMHGYL